MKKRNEMKSKLEEKKYDILEELVLKGPTMNEMLEHGR